jgi:hypothetical protein
MLRDRGMKGWYFSGSGRGGINGTGEDDDDDDGENGDDDDDDDDTV